jgi:hypothetical protein
MMRGGGGGEGLCGQREVVAAGASLSHACGGLIEVVTAMTVTTRLGLSF